MFLISINKKRKIEFYTNISDSDSLKKTELRSKSPAKRKLKLERLPPGLIKGKFILYLLTDNDIKSFSITSRGWEG